MSLPFYILNELDKIKRDRRHGARELACMALQLLRRCLREFSGNEGEELITFLLKVAKAIAETRISMASIANSMAALVYNALKEEVMTRSSIVNMVNKQLNQLDRAFQKVIVNTANIIVTESTVITCSYSSTIYKALVEAKKLGGHFKVMVLSSPSPNGSIRYGVLLRDKLSATGVNAIVLPEEEIETRIESVDIALIGADSIYPDGFILNGTPTLMLAEKAFEQDKLFYVSCETLKINSMSLLGFTPTIEEGIDSVPVELITALITENGFIRPIKIPEYTDEFLERLKIIFPD